MVAAAALLGAAIVLAAMTFIQPSTAAAAKKGKVREFEGRVLKVNRGAGNFVQRRGNGRKVRVKVKRRTRFEDVRRFRKLRRGMRVETDARYNGSRWVGLKVDRDDSDFDSDSDDADSDSDSDSDSD